MPIYKKDLTKEMVVKAMQCKTPEELMDMAKAGGFTITREEDGHLALGDEMENEGAEACSEQGSGGIKPHEQRNQDSGTEGHEQELDPHDGLSGSGQLSGFHRCINYLKKEVSFAVTNLHRILVILRP